MGKEIQKKDIAAKSRYSIATMRAFNYDAAIDEGEITHPKNKQTKQKQHQHTSLWSSTEDYAQGRPLNETVTRSPKTLCKQFCAMLRIKHTAIRSSSLARMEHLTPVMKKYRSDFTTQHRHWSLADSKEVLLSNECSSQQYAPHHVHIR